MPLEGIRKQGMEEGVDMPYLAKRAKQPYKRPIESPENTASLYSKLTMSCKYY
jgi:hypothetical protein